MGQKGRKMSDSPKKTIVDFGPNLLGLADYEAGYNAGIAAAEALLMKMANSVKAYPLNAECAEDVRLAELMAEMYRSFLPKLAGEVGKLYRR
jgi:hypothetical protein